MISARLVQLIESHGDQTIDRVAAQIRREPEMTHGNSVLQYELRGLSQELLNHLGDWLSSGAFYDLARRYEGFGTVCYEQAIPLHQALRGMYLLREKMLDVAQEHMISNSSIELYAEEELERRLGRFFDRLSMQMARGFEEAARRPAASRTTVH